jgi:hypothetical protein
MLRVAISQPEHFPYLGFFQKMAASDVFVILDDAQFSGPSTFQNRNRLRSPCGRDEWLTVPVRRAHHAFPINKVEVSSDPNWRLKLRRKLDNYFHRDFSKIYASQYLCEINLASIQFVRAAFDIQVPLVMSSSLNQSGDKAEKIRNICHTLGATTYICGSGGAKYLSPDDLSNVNIEYFKEHVPDYYSSLMHLTPSQIEQGMLGVLHYNSKP